MAAGAGSSDAGACQASTPAARSVIRKNVPDIRLQKPASTVAIITNSKRRLSILAPRRVLRMMMKGAAKTRNGPGGEGLGDTAPRKKPKSGGLRKECLKAAGERARQREADAKRKQG